MRPEGRPEKNAPYGPVGGAVVATDWPKLPAPNVSIGEAKFGWLSTLYKFAPPPSPTLSVNLKFLLTLKSVSKKPGPRNWFRTWVGNVPAVPTVANPAALRHPCPNWLQLPCPAPITSAGKLGVTLL